MIASAYSHLDHGTLWCAGGWGDQPSAWCDGVAQVAVLRAEWEEEERRKADAAAKRRGSHA